MTAIPATTAPPGEEPSDAAQDDYARRVRQQIEQYEADVAIHDLPAIFHEWSNRFVLPGIKAVYGKDTIIGVYADGFMDSVNRVGGRPRFLSLGCGDGGTEIEIAQELHALGLKEFDFVCIDLSPLLLQRFAERIPPGLVDCFILRHGDINQQIMDQRFHAIMANHSLHHMVELEEIFAATFAALHDQGSFLTNDMIGRNGHQRWPETRIFVDFFWPMLTERQRNNLQLRRPEPRFIDHDCSTSGFEGIRAQDILPLILAAGFRSHSFLGFGGFIDPFVDRSFGHNFSPAEPDDVFLIRRMGLLNEILLDTGAIKPTMMLARFVKYPTNEIAYRRRTAAASLRDTDRAPTWLAGALADLELVADDPAFVFKRETQESRSLIAEIVSLRKHIDDLQTSLAAQADRVAALDRQAEEQTRLIDRLHASTSWRVTSPLRRIMRGVRGR